MTNVEPSLFDGTEYAPQPHKKIVNVASVPNRSPFRYPGGKTWLVPTIRKWLGGKSPKNLIEPFCGGGTVALTAAAEGLVEKATMIEMDNDVAAVWRVILDDGEWLARRILEFNLTIESVAEITKSEPRTDKERAFATIIRNRTNHGGILAPGSGTLKRGENGKGIASRWYPSTLAKRIRDIQTYREKITFIQGNAFNFFSPDTYNNDSYYFIDPPYTVAGKRLYSLSEVNHELLFEQTSKLNCHFLMTYDLSDYIIELAEKYNMEYRTIPMRTTHLVKKEELLISNNFDWLQ